MRSKTASYFGGLFIILLAATHYVGFTYDEYRWTLLLLNFWVLMRMVMNVLDGMLAREYNEATPGGEIANEALDVFGDTIVYGAFFFIPNSPHLAVTIFLISIWAAEFFGVLGKGLPGGVRRHETHGGGKPDRSILVLIYCMIYFFYPPIHAYFEYFLYGLSALVFWTCVVRIMKTLEGAKGKEYTSYTRTGR